MFLYLSQLVEELDSIDDALKIFDPKADKIAINTAAVKNPSLINFLAKRFGSPSSGDFY